MIGSLFNTILYQPLYNGLIFVLDVLPAANAAVAVVLLTVCVKVLLFPLSKKAVTTQLKMRLVEPEIKKVRETYAEDRQKQAEEMMKLYKEQDINPFASLVVIFIQLPIIIALYWIFLNSGLPEVNAGLLYSFIPNPGAVDMSIFGLIDISGKSWVLAVAAAVTSFFQIRYSLPPVPEKVDAPSFKDDLARSMNVQMRYVFPFVILFIAYTVSGAVALYWTTSNIFTLGQEWVIRKKVKEPFEKEHGTHDNK